ncbi:MAG: BON domain-containing protein [Pirellulales bacterium]|nr:BON domain-containing protein [Pirellulales bacterium]
MTELLLEDRAALDTAHICDAETLVIAGDHDLERRVLNFLISRQVPCAHQIDISASGGEVTLRGRVASYYHKQLCVHCAQRVAGVIRVVDQIRVKSRPARVG